MSFPAGKENLSSEIETSFPSTRSWASSFRRTQLMLGWWGIVLIVGGILHNNYASPKAWGMGAILWVWFGLTVLGLVGTYFLNSASLSSGMLWVWAVVLTLGMLITLLLIYPLNNGGKPIVAVAWHAFFLLGYLLTGYYMDRRLWLLAGWELAILLVTLLLSGSPATTPIVTPAPKDDDGYSYHMLILNARIFADQVLGIDLSKNLGLNLGVSSGVPLLIAALPFWKERYGKN